MKMVHWSSKHTQTIALMALIGGLLVSGCGTPNQVSKSGNTGVVTSAANNTVGEATSGAKNANTVSANTAQNNAAVSDPNSSTSTASSQAPLTLGSIAPNFTLQNINGQGTVSLKQLLAKGKPVLINAFASWCPPCKMETPDLVKMSKKYGNQVQFVGLNLTSIDNVRDAKAFVSHYNIPYPVLLDSKGAFRDAYTVIAEPTTFLLSPQGKILDIQIGMMTSSQMEQFIQGALQS